MKGERGTGVFQERMINAKIFPLTAERVRTYLLLRGRVSAGCQWQPREGNREAVEEVSPPRTLFYM